MVKYRIAEGDQVKHAKLTFDLYGDVKRVIYVDDTLKMVQVAWSGTEQFPPSTKWESPEYLEVTTPNYPHAP